MKYNQKRARKNIYIYIFRFIKFLLKGMKGNINNKQFQYFKILDGSLCEKMKK